MTLTWRNGLVLLAFLILLTGCSTQPDISNELVLESPRYGHAAVTDGEKLYILAGANHTGMLSDIEIIDPNTGHHEVLADMLIHRRYFSAVFDGKESIYIIGGVNFVGKRLRFERRVEVFNTKTRKVTFAPPVLFPTRINTAVFHDGNIYVMGGAYPTRKGLKPTNISKMFNIASQTWHRIADMPTAKTTRAVVYQNKIYVVGGYNRKTAMTVFERYDPKTNQWQSLPAMPEKISAHSVSLAGDKLWVFGDYERLDSTYRYDFNTKAWEKADIGYQSSRHNAAIAIGNTTYVIGGNVTGNGFALDDIQAFEF